MCMNHNALHCNRFALHKNKNICCLHIYINKTHINNTNIQNPCAIFLLHNLTALHQSINTTPSTETKQWLQCMEEKSTHSYNQTYKSSPRLPFYFLKANCILNPYLMIQLLHLLSPSKLLNKKTSSVYDCTVEDVEYIWNSNSTLVDWACYDGARAGVTVALRGTR